ncbi:hypothetical protein SALWKB2_1962 [Snodgrassella alvi wkB2]|nr:hypothetical protein SALWKB2_1962 [Snodgrassella alvi wkB2]
MREWRQLCHTWFILFQQAWLQCNYGFFTWLECGYCGLRVMPC